MTITTIATGGLLVPFARADVLVGDVALSGVPTNGRDGFDATASRLRTHALVPTAAAYMAQVQDSPSRGRPV